METAGPIAIVLVLILSFVLYFLPTIVANKKGHPNAGFIFVVNLLFGWSLIGWLVALIWALGGNRALLDSNLGRREQNITLNVATAASAGTPVQASAGMTQAQFDEAVQREVARQINAAQQNNFDGKSGV